MDVLQQLFQLVLSRIDLVDTLTKRTILTPFANQRPTSPGQNSSINSQVDTQGTEQRRRLMRLIVHTRKIEKGICVQENRLMEYIFSAHLEGNEIITYFALHSLQIMKRLETEFLCLRNFECSQQYLCKLFSQFMERCGNKQYQQQLATIQENSLHQQIPFMPLLMKWLLEVSRQRFHTTANALHNRTLTASRFCIKSNSITTQTNSNTTTCPNTSQRKERTLSQCSQQEHKSLYVFEEVQQHKQSTAKRINNTNIQMRKNSQRARPQTAQTRPVTQKGKRATANSNQQKTSRTTTDNFVSTNTPAIASASSTPAPSLFNNCVLRQRQLSILSTKSVITQSSGNNTIALVKPVQRTTHVSKQALDQLLDLDKNINNDPFAQCLRRLQYVPPPLSINTTPSDTQHTLATPQIYKNNHQIGEHGLQCLLAIMQSQNTHIQHSIIQYSKAYFQRFPETQPALKQQQQQQQQQTQQFSNPRHTQSAQIPPQQKKENTAQPRRIIIASNTSHPQVQRLRNRVSLCGFNELTNASFGICRTPVNAQSNKSMANFEETYLLSTAESLNAQRTPQSASVKCVSHPHNSPLSNSSLPPHYVNGVRIKPPPLCVVGNLMKEEEQEAIFKQHTHCRANFTKNFIKSCENNAQSSHSMLLLLQREKQIIDQKMAERNNNQGKLLENQQQTASLLKEFLQNNLNFNVKNLQYAPYSQQKNQNLASQTVSRRNKTIIREIKPDLSSRVAYKNLIQSSSQNNNFVQSSRSRHRHSTIQSATGFENESSVVGCEGTASWRNKALINCTPSLIKL